LKRQREIDFVKKRLLTIVLMLSLLGTILMPSSFALSTEYKGDYELLNYLPQHLSPGYPVDSFIWSKKSVSDVEAEINGPKYQALSAKTMEIIAGIEGDYQKAEAISAWIHDNIRYDYNHSPSSNDSYDAYSVLEAGKGICNGFAHLTQMMLYFADIASIRIGGLPNKRAVEYIGHAWNAALIDGIWVFMDSTWGIFDMPYDYHDSVTGFTYYDNLVEFNVSYLGDYFSGDEETRERYFRYHKPDEVNVNCIILEGSTGFCFPTEYDYIIVFGTRNYGGTELIIPDNVKLWYFTDFFSKTLEKIRLPSTLTEVGDDMFKSCSALREVEIPDSVEVIRSRAFSFGASLTSITIPSSVRLIEPETFINSLNLTIYGQAGSYAEQYAIENNIRFIVITPSSWAATQVAAAISAGFVPESLQLEYTTPTTRAEFCALAVTFFELVAGSEITERRTFIDTDDVNVEKMAGLGVVNGVGDNMFSPDGTLTREQAATILAQLAKAIGKPLGQNVPTFIDNERISSWAFDAVGQVQATDIMGGVGDNRFSPDADYTREQSIVTIMRLLDYIS